MRKDRFLLKLGQRMVALRKDKGWSQRDLAYECGKEPQSITRIENGQSNPTAFYLKTIADALGVTLSELVDF